jgi:hypothetical protein
MRLLLVLLSIAAAGAVGCGGSSGKPDGGGAAGGTVGSGGGGGASGAGGGRGGAGGDTTDGGCGPASIPDAGSTGGSGSQTWCSPSSTCGSGGAGQPPTGPCTVDGSRCTGVFCPDARGYPWAAICCNGQWANIPTSAAASAVCPKPPSPGDSFPCGTSGLTCVAGQTYCYERNDPTRLGAPSITSCEPLCTAGDCSCLCGRPASTCTFVPPDKVCASDTCFCAPARDPLGITLPGTVAVRCDFEFRPQPTCNRVCGYDLDCMRYGPGGAAYACWGAATPGGGCEPFSKIISGPSCGVESQYYCCPG